MGSNHSPEWEPIILELSQEMSAWILWMASRDLEQWHSGRRTRLTREEATSVAMFIYDSLPPELRTEVPNMPPALKAG